MHIVRVATTRITVLCVSAAACAALLGCGGDGSNITRAGRTPIEQRVDGSLTRLPDPLSVEDLGRLPPDSAQLAVFRLWFYGQWGSSLNTVRFYDQRVRRAVGDSAVAGAYASERLRLLDSHPQVRSVTSTGAGTLVTVNMLTTSAPPRPEFFLLRRQTVGWRIVYDSVLARALPAYVQAQMGAVAAHADSAASRRAIAASTNALDRYRRTLFSDLSASRADELGPERVSDE